MRSPVLVYDDDPTAPPAARALPPEELAKLIDRNVLSSHIFHGGPYSASSGSFWKLLWEEGGPLVLERPRRSALIVRMAAELHRRETGRMPSKAGELVGPYLESLPEGIAAEDPIPEEVVESLKP